MITSERSQHFRCIFGGTKKAKPELLSAIYKETGDLHFMKFIVRSLVERPVRTRDAEIRFSNIKMYGQALHSFSGTSIQDFLLTSSTLHLVEYEKRGGWKASPYGLAWILLSERKAWPLTFPEKLFLLRHLLMIDSNNCGLWLTSILNCLSSAKETPVSLSEIKRDFAKTLLDHANKRFNGMTISHKIEPMLSYAKDLGLIGVKKRSYFVTRPGEVLAQFHERLRTFGFKAFHEEGGKFVTDALSSLDEQHRVRELTAAVFERCLRDAVREVRIFVSSRKPVSIPFLRSVCCTRLLERGFVISDRDFDRFLVEVVSKKYYEYSFFYSKSAPQYPYLGIKGPSGIFSFFDVVRPLL